MSHVVVFDMGGVEDSELRPWLDEFDLRSIVL